MLKKRFFAMLGIALVSGCISPYEIPITESQSNILVVDAVVDCSSGVATVKLTRTAPLHNTEVSPFVESNASVIITDAQGTEVSLVEEQGGLYEEDITVDYSKSYKLKIVTFDEQVYESDDIKFLNTPAIETVEWSLDQDGVVVTVNTSDPGANIGYYKWKFHETWEYNAEYFSHYKIVNGEIIMRPGSESVYNCWNSEASSSILVASTARLNKNVINNYVLTRLPKRSMKLFKKYSILVSQYSIDKASFEYWQNLKKTNESLGGLFDPLPYEVRGNITCTSDPSRPVLGYFYGSSVSQRRIFIDSQDIPEQYRGVSTYACPVDTLYIKNLPPDVNLEFPIALYPDPFPIAYLTTFIECVDCRKRGGVNIKPDFWQ